MIYLLAVLQLIDIWSTLEILKRNGTELNPFLAKLFVKFGALKTMLVVKSLFMVAIIYSGNQYVIGGFIVVYALVCYNNIRQLK